MDLTKILHILKMVLKCPLKFEDPGKMFTRANECCSPTTSEVNKFFYH